MAVADKEKDHNKSIVSDQDKSEDPKLAKHRNPKDIDYGLDAFRAALQPQEGQFMRGASVVLNPPKDLPFKPSRGGTDTKSTGVLGLTEGEKNARQIAAALVDRNAKGQFIKQGE